MKEEAQGPGLRGLAGEPPADVGLHEHTHRRFPEALTELRRRRRLSYRQLAYKSGHSAGYLDRLSKGNRSPDEGTLPAIANALRVPPDYFFEYRMRQILRELEARPRLADDLYLHLVKDDGDLKAGVASDAQPGNAAWTARRARIVLARDSPPCEGTRAARASVTGPPRCSQATAAGSGAR